MMYEVRGTCRETAYALALADSCREAGFHAGIQVGGARGTSSRIVTVPHASGSASIRVAMMGRPEEATRRFGGLLLDVDAAEPLEAVLAALRGALETLQAIEGASPPIRLPAAFCGRLEA